MKLFALLLLILNPSISIAHTPPISLQEEAFLSPTNPTTPTIAKPLPLTIWLRAWGKETNEEVATYVESLSGRFSPFFTLKILLATNLHDPILESPRLKQLVNQEKVHILYANLQSFSSSLNTLADHTENKAPTLCLSLGLDISVIQIIEALSWLQIGCWAYGWEIDSMHNDGSQPGKGWYNTAVLYHPCCVDFIQKEHYPFWIDNGALGEIKIPGQKIVVGGGEEVPLMKSILENNPEAFFILNTRDPVHLLAHTGTSLNFQKKLARKTIVANYYIQNVLHTTANAIWKSLWVIDSSHQRLLNGLELLAPHNNSSD